MLFFYSKPIAAANDTRGALASINRWSRKSFLSMGSELPMKGASASSACYQARYGNGYLSVRDLMHLCHAEQARAYGFYVGRIKVRLPEHLLQREAGIGGLR